MMHNYRIENSPHAVFPGYVGWLNVYKVYDDGGHSHLVAECANRETAEAVVQHTALIAQRDALRTALGALIAYKNQSAEWKEAEDPTGSYLHILCEQADTALALPDPDAGDTAR